MINMPSLKRPFYAVWLSLFLVNVLQADTISLMLFNKTDEDIVLSDWNGLHHMTSVTDGSRNVYLYKNKWHQIDFDMDFIPISYENAQTVSFENAKSAKNCIVITMHPIRTNKSRQFRFCLQDEAIWEETLGQILGYITINDCYQVVDILRPKNGRIKLQLQLNRKGKTYFASHPEKLKSGPTNDLGIISSGCVEKSSQTP